MGSLCSCCSRHKLTLSPNTSNDANAQLLNASDDVDADQISNLVTSVQSSTLAPAGYGATSYTRLKDKTGTTHTLNSDHPMVQHRTPNDIIQETHGTDTKKRDKKEHTDDTKDGEEHHISVTTTNILITGAGFDEVNGGYRWFPHQSKWCLFGENISYALDNGVNVDDVYTQLTRLQSVEAKFRWKEDVEKCWIISNMDGSAIYYAAAQSKEYEEYVPNRKDLWISVHGSLPAPDIFANLLEGSNPPDKNDSFGNVSPKFSFVKQRSHGSSVSSLQPITETDKIQSPDMTEFTIDRKEKEDGCAEVKGSVVVDDEEDSLSDLN